jgi:hypothetical protein
MRFNQRELERLDRNGTPYCYLFHRGHREDGRPMTECNGRLVEAHLLPKQLLKRHGVTELYAVGSWVWACGGPDYGADGHHGEFDSSRTLRLARFQIPDLTERFAKQYGLEWYLDRTYGPQEEPPHD